MELQLSLFAQIEQLKQPTPELPVLRNYSYTEEIGVGGVKEKVKRNLEAIRLLQLLEETGRHPEREQKAVLAQYMGFGLAPELFMETPPASWQELACLLKELVSTEHQVAVRAVARKQCQFHRSYKTESNRITTFGSTTDPGK